MTLHLSASKLATVIMSQPDGIIGYADKRKIPFVTDDDRILVCLADKGECRGNSRYYSSALGDNTDDWDYPQVGPNCNRVCPHRLEVTQSDDPEAKKHSPFNPSGFKWLKNPTDACQNKANSKIHESKQCPQCSLPKPKPNDNWLDVKAIERASRNKFKSIPVEFDRPRTETASTTEFTKKVIKILHKKQKRRRTT
jgi:hypothetical protein